VQRAGILQYRADRADDGDFQPIEDPRHAERDDQQEVKAAPWEPIQPLWDVSADGASCGAGRRTLFRAGWRGLGRWVWGGDFFGLRWVL
jgi:hypothetical protein